MSLRIPPPLIALVSLLLMWLFAEQLPALQVPVPYSGLIAGFLVVVGLAIDITAILAFRRAKTTVTPLNPEKASRLVVSGLYRFSRNPMYLGMLIILSGAAIWFGTPISILILIGFVGYITTFQIKPEEARLDQLFGEEYRAYRQRVRRWL